MEAAESIAASRAGSMPYWCIPFLAWDMTRRRQNTGCARHLGSSCSVWLVVGDNRSRGSGEGKAVVFLYAVLVGSAGHCSETRTYRAHWLRRNLRAETRQWRRWKSWNSVKQTNVVTAELDEEEAWVATTAKVKVVEKGKLVERTNRLR